MPFMLVFGGEGRPTPEVSDTEGNTYRDLSRWVKLGEICKTCYKESEDGD